MLSLYLFARRYIFAVFRLETVTRESLYSQEWDVIVGNSYTWLYEKENNA